MTDISSPSASYKKMMQEQIIVDSLWGGTEKMRAERERYLPKNDGESYKAYEARLSRTYLQNYFRFSLSGLVGKVFKKPFVAKDVPKIMETYSENINLQGDNLNVFSKDVFLEGLKYGLSHILVDYPRSENKIKSLLDEKKAGLRPYLVHISSKDIIGCRFENVNGIPKLTQVRIRENITRADAENPYEDKIIERIKLLEINKFQIWEQNNDKSWVLADEGQTSLDYIPLFTFYTNKTGNMQGITAFKDLAYMNIRHWQSSSDQNNILHVARCPILFAKGFNTEKFTKLNVGANTALVNDDVQSDVKFVEHTGSAISAGRQDLLDIEENMQMLALSVIMQKSGNITATQKMIDSEDSNSLLKQWALGLEDTIGNAVWAIEDYDNQARGAYGWYSVNTDFEISARDNTDLQILLQARQACDISRDAFLKEMQRRNVLSVDFNPEEDANLLEQNEVLF